MSDNQASAVDPRAGPARTARAHRAPRDRDTRTASKYACFGTRVCQASNKQNMKPAHFKAQRANRHSYFIASGELIQVLHYLFLYASV